MSEQKNVETVKRGYAAFQRGGLQTVLNLRADDIDFVTPSQLPSAFPPPSYSLSRFFPQYAGGGNAQGWLAFILSCSTNKSRIAEDNSLSGTSS